MKKYNRKKDRIAVTGLGVVSPVGSGKNAFWKNLVAGKSGVRKMRLFDTTEYRTNRGAEVIKFAPSGFFKKHSDKNKSSQFLLKAMDEARKDAKLDLKSVDPGKIGIIVGGDTSEKLSIEKISNKLHFKGADGVPGALVKRALDAPAVACAREFGVEGPVETIAVVCAAGNYAIARGFELLRQNRAKVVFCCGVDVINKALLAGFDRMFLTSRDVCSPFSKHRKGLIIGEGAGVLILEKMTDAKRRKAHIYAEVLGYGLSCDAFNMTIPSKDGIKMVMKKAMRMSGLKRADVDCINAHGTGTLNNDKAEAFVVREIFGELADSIPVTSIKSMIGHCISAASSLEAVSCCLTLRDGIIPPTINFTNPDPECNINVVANKALKKSVKVILNNSFAFGGNNACVAFRKV